ncbi:MAG: hypothetical protein U0794_09665 [Isosphaeraceae bacterium]
MLRERGVEPGRIGRTPLPDPLDSLRSGWRRATAAQQAEFMAEVGLVDAGPDDAADARGRSTDRAAKGEPGG